MDFSAVTNTLSGVGPSSRAGTSTAVGGKSSFDQILAAFEKEAMATPAQRARDAVLKKHHLTEDQYSKLPKAEKDSIAREIADAVRRAMEQQASNAKRHQMAGFAAD